jgi:hypothetical protein
MESAPLAGPMVIDSWLSAANGDASGFWLLSVASKVAFPGSFIWGEMAAFGGADDEAGREYFSSPPEHDSVFGEGLPGTTFVWGGGELADAWPDAPDAAQYDRVRKSNVETLLIGGELDPTTPPQIATEQLLPYLPNGKQVILDGFGHSLDFWTYQPDAGTRLITRYLETGRVDRSLYEPQRVDFTPEVTHTALAKGFAGTMVGLPLLALLSLLWMAVRVRRRGGYGRKASAVLRSLYAVVLGFGGWLLGVLIVLVALPGTPIDDELLAMLSVGVPVGLGVYLAWVSRGQAKAIGLAAAAAGALVGASLGFHAGTDLLALLTAIAGAVAGANLTLILLDLARASSERVAASASPEPAAPVPAQIS